MSLGSVLFFSDPQKKRKNFLQNFRIFERGRSQNQRIGHLILMRQAHTLRFWPFLCGLDTFLTFCIICGFGGKVSIKCVRKEDTFYGEVVIMANLADEQHYYVVKSNALIQKSRFNLTVQEQKIILYLITKLLPDDDKFKLYEFKIGEFCKICGIDEDNGANYKYIKQTLKSLRDKSIWLDVGDGMEITLAWIDQVVLRKNDGTIQVKINDVMRPYLLQLKEQFTKYEFYYVLAMRSKYSVRLYELLKSYESLGKCRFDIDDFKKMVDAQNYKRHPDFTRYVLDIAVREINDYGDLHVTYELEKIGRKFSKIKFRILHKKSLTTGKITETIDNNVEKRIAPEQLRGQM